MDEAQIAKDFLVYLLRRIEVDRDDLLEEFFLNRGDYGRERRAATVRMLDEIGGE